MFYRDTHSQNKYPALNMTKLYTATVISFLLLCLADETFGQQALVTDAKKQELANFSNLQNSLFLSGRQKALSMAKTFGWPIVRRTKNGGLLSLQGINSLGFPIYLITDDNTTAAATTQTNSVQPGGPLVSAAIPVMRWSARQGMQKIY